MTRGLQGNMFIMTVKESGFIRHIFLYSLNLQQGQYHSSFFLRTFPIKEYEIEGRYNMLCRRVLHLYKNIQNRLLYMR